MAQLKRISGELIAENENKSLKQLAERHKAYLRRADLSEAVLSGAYLSGADLSRADLRRADLSGADLSRAVLRRADLSGAYLIGADLSRAVLRRAVLSEADLSGADLSGAYLIGADLSRAVLRRAVLNGAVLNGADLSGADLSGAYLRRVDLSGTKIEFHQFPSIRLLSSMPIKKISDDLILELMRWDAYAHPHPEKFDKWAKGGECPYQNEERWWFLPEKRKIWKSGNPTMRLSELILEICRQQGWGIKGYLEMKGKSNGI